MRMKKSAQLLVLTLLAFSIGLCVWQGYELKATQTAANEYVAKTVYSSVGRLAGAGTFIDSLNENNDWDDRENRLALIGMLTTIEVSLSNTLSALTSGSDKVPYEQTQCVTNFLFHYRAWYGKAINNLYKSGPLTEEDKEHVLQFSRIIAEIKSYNPGNWTDLNALMTYMSELDKAWRMEQ